MTTKTKAPPTGLQFIDVALIVEPTNTVRKSVDKETQKYKNLVASMKANGFWKHKPIGVSQGPPHVLTDGTTRLEAAKDAGLGQVWAVVEDKALSDGERLRQGFVSNSTAITMRPVDDARALQQLQVLNPGWTLERLAKEVHQETSWVMGRLKVGVLEGDAADLVNRGKIPLASGAALAKLKRAGVELTPKLLTRAQQEPASEFVPDAEALLKARKAPVVKIRPTGEIKAELARATKDKSTPAGYLEALRWVTRNDPASNVEAKAKKAK